MALPWIIGAAVLGIGAALASALSDDEDKSSNNNSSDEERRRRETAEQERKERTLKQKKAIILASFTQDGEKRADDFKQALSGLIDVEYPRLPAFKAVLNNDGNQYKRLVSLPFVQEQGLGFLDEITKKNLTYFETLYDAELMLEPCIYDTYEDLIECKEALTRLSDYRRKLESLHHQLGKSQEGL